MMLSKPILLFFFPFISDILLSTLRYCQWEGTSNNLSGGHVL